jgi:hypothetical protein
MKSVILSMLLLGGFIVLSTVDASAYVCARGVYRAGCVGPRGAVVVRHPYHRPYYGRVYR